MIRVRLTPQQYEDLGGKLWSQAGLEIAGNSGKLSKDGVTAEYSYDGTTLQVQVVKHPLLVTENYCETKIREAFAVQGYAAQ